MNSIFCNIMKFLKLAIFSCLIIAGNSSAQQDSVRVLRSVPTESPVLDGVLEADWWGSPVGADFIQREPDEGIPSTEGTEVRVMHSPDALYVAFRCYESDPSLIETTLNKRDRIWNCDRVVLFLDTYHDHRTAFFFGTNPSGVQLDGTFRNDYHDDDDWDGYWEVATAIDDSGWVAEFKIPYSTIRFNTFDEEQSWGFNAFRFIQRNKEMSYWQSVSRDHRERVSEFGHLEGLSGLTPGRGLEFRPYAVADFAEEGATPLQGENNWENLGIDVKYRLSTNLTLDATFNPDFAQIEADNEVINLSDYPVYLSEKRPFFMEGADIFDTEMELFYSRRITNPETGVKITGKIGNTRIAGIAARNLNEDEETEDFSVLRLKRDVLEKSEIGLLFTDKEDASGGYSRVWSADARFRFGDPWSTNLQVAQSYKPELTNDNWAYSLGSSYSSDKYSGSVWASGKARNFRGNDAGWISYTDYHRVGTWMQWAPRPEKWGIRRIGNNLNGGLEWQVDGQFREKWWNYNNSIQTMNYWYFGFGLNQSSYWRRNYVDDGDPYEFSDNFGNFNMENYSGGSYWVWFETDFAKPLAFDIGHSQGNFRDGYEKEIWGGVQWRPKENLVLRLNSELDHIEGVTDIEDGQTTDYIVSQLKIEWTLSLRLFTRLNTQYVHEDEAYLTNMLIGYNFAPESYLYLVYDDNRNELLGWDSVQDRKIKLKVSYFVQI
ncbi:hypothetical protein CEE37_08400 [candidate division LCP-89 bacterium B3_LCP]|uniref:Uncharacterized protein n=1 Tax=candidate division LCP-89 bacterium B3_LCP TaxID=2012998 RepID=A0A532V042_UNCL8|nr:MAG: hypothetical protein CEE37_08400 [candidate division LCP-89 bacterium B3_LCP]